MRLWRCGIDVVMTDLARPTAIRRTVAFSDAIVHGENGSRGLRAVRAENAAEAKKLLREGSLPVLADPECACREELAPDALVDAILAKRNLGTKIDDAPIVVGVGPGFTAGGRTATRSSRRCAATRSGASSTPAAHCRTRTFPASSAALRASACCARVRRHFYCRPPHRRHGRGGRDHRLCRGSADEVHHQRCAARRAGRRRAR